MGLRDYIAHRTVEQEKADKEAADRDERMKNIKKRIDEEHKNQIRPSRLQEDLSKLSKKIVTGAKKGIAIAAPVVKQVAVGTAKSLKQGVEQAAPVVERMGRGAAETEFYEPERKRAQERAQRPSQPQRSPQPPQPPQKPQKQRQFVDDTAPAPRIGKKYDADQFINENRPKPRTDDDEFGVGGFSMSRRPKQEKEAPRKPMKQPEGADKYFVNVNKKRVPPKEEKKKGSGGGFGLGF